MSTGSVLYPSLGTSVTSLPGQFDSKRPERAPPGDAGEFEKTLQNQLNDIKPSLKLSAHAAQRVRERKIPLDQKMMSRVTEAVDRAEAKGLADTLILTGDAALIVNVPNRTIVTALDRNGLQGNVFTNIDGAIVI